jgi:hypothetical protein
VNLSSKRWTGSYIAWLEDETQKGVLVSGARVREKAMWLCNHKTHSGVQKKSTSVIVGFKVCLKI